MTSRKRVSLLTLRIVLIFAAILFLSISLLGVIFAALFHFTLPELTPGIWLAFFFTSMVYSLLIGLTLSLYVEKRYAEPLEGLIRKARQLSIGKESTPMAAWIKGSRFEELHQSLEEMQDSARQKIYLSDRNRKELEKLFMVVPCYITVQDRDFRIVRSNLLFQKDFGDNPGKCCYEIYKNRGDICPNCAVEKTFRDGKVHSREEEVVTRDGRTVSLIVYSAPITDEQGETVAVMEMSTDISEIKLLQKELDTQSQKLEQLFNIVPGYISIEDKNFTILQTNEMFKRDFGIGKG